MSETPRGLLLGPGDEIDGFVIEAIAGRGGMGIVYRARQQRPDRVVALKVIAPDLAGDPAFRTRFERESTIAAQIEHPNVIPVYAVGEADGVLYIAMRFVEGTDLRSLLASERRLEPDRAAAIVEAVGQALDAAHAHGLVHRDVKPANILLAPVGGREHVYLTDFGLSRHIQSSSGPTRTGAFMGTIDYVAPEQARGERVDARADVYSLGCVLFTALTGTVPFDLDNDLAKLYAHDRKPPPSALERAPDLPAAFESVLARAMAKAPDERYPSAGDLGRAGVAAAAGALLSPDEERTVAEGAAAPPPEPPPPEPKPPEPEPEPEPDTAPTPRPEAVAPPPTRVQPPPAGPGRRRRMLLPGAGLAVAVVIAVVALSAGGGGGGGGGGDGGGDTTAAPPSTPAAAGDVVAIPEGNLTANPSFEDDLSGWDTANGELARVPADDAPDGGDVASVTLTGAATDYSIDDSPDTVESSTKGSTYTATAWVKGTEATDGNPVCLTIRERSTDGEKTFDERSAQVTADVARYKRVVVSHVAITDGSRVDVHLFREGDDLEDEGFLVDAITLVEGTTDARSADCEF